jgi:hypothetical protein
VPSARRPVSADRAAGLLAEIRANAAEAAAIFGSVQEALAGATARVDAERAKVATQAHDLDLLMAMVSPLQQAVLAANRRVAELRADLATATRTVNGLNALVGPLQITVFAERHATEGHRRAAEDLRRALDLANARNAALRVGDLAPSPAAELPQDTARPALHRDRQPRRAAGTANGSGRCNANCTGFSRCDRQRSGGGTHRRPGANAGSGRCVGRCADCCSGCGINGGHAAAHR